MFEKILIEKNSDVGLIAETLLFYDRVYILVTENSIRGLFQKVDPRIFIPFLEENSEHIKMEYLQSDFSPNTWSYPPDILLRILYEEEVEKYPYLRSLRKEANLDTPDGEIHDTKLTSRFLKLLSVGGNNRKDLEGIINEINSEDYFKSYFVNELIKQDINIDYEDLDIKLDQTEHDIYRIQCSCKESIMAPDIRGTVISYISNMLSLLRSSKYNSDILYKGDPTAFQYRVNSLIDRTQKKQQQINYFQEIITEGKMLRETINSGDRTFQEFIQLYNKANRFKSWLSELEPEKNLVESYYKEAFTNTWLDKLPVKTTRWMVFQGIGLMADVLGAGGIGTVAGIGLNAFDTFILDKMIKGWRPNQFIDNNLKVFYAK